FWSALTARATMRAGSGSVLVLQLDVPVGHVGPREERQPLRVEGSRLGRAAEERRPARPRGDAQELHARLLRRAAALAQVAADAGADDVLPARHAAVAARHHMVEVQ